MITLGQYHVSVYCATSVEGLRRQLGVPEERASQAVGKLTLAIVSCDANDLRAKRQRALAALAGSDDPINDDAQGIYFEPRPFGAGSIAFVFPGQGSQYPGMLSGYLALESFSEAVREFDVLGKPIFARSLRDWVFADASEATDTGLAETRAAQASIGFVSAALARMLGSFGVRAQMAAGHSYGELVALWYAGALEDRTLLHLTERRAAFMASAAQIAPGGMAAVAEDEPWVVQLLQDFPGVEIANLNTRKQTIIAGDTQTLDQVAACCAQQGVRMVRLTNTAAAFHTSRMESALPGWGAFLAERAAIGDLGALRRASVIANVTASEYLSCGGRDMAKLLTQQVVGRVRWRESCERLYEMGARVFVEVGPSKILTRTLNQNLSNRAHKVFSSDPQGAEATLHLARLLAQLAVQGVLLDANKHPNITNIKGPTKMRPQMEEVVREFFSENGKLVDRYFGLAEKIIETSGASASPEVLLRFLEQSAQVTSECLSAQEHGLQVVSAGDFSGVERQESPSGQHAFATPTAVLVPATAAIPTGTPGAELESWLRTEIARVTGFPPSSIGLSAHFDELGIDSLAFTELFQRFTTYFPAARIRAKDLFSAKSISAILDVLLKEPSNSEAVRTPSSVESGETAFFVQLGETQSVALDEQELRPQERWSTDLALMRERIFRAVHDLRGGPQVNVTDDTSFDELELNGFDRETLWQSTALATSPYALAGEALMATNTIGEALTLLEKLERRNEPSENAERAQQVADALCRYVQIEVSRPLPSAQDETPQRVLLIGSQDAAFKHFQTGLAAAGIVVQTLSLTAEGWYDSNGVAFALDAHDELEKRLAQTRHPDIATPIIFLTPADCAPLATSADQPLMARLDRNAIGVFCIAKALATSQDARLGHGHLGIVLTSGPSPADVAARGVARSLSHEWRGAGIGVTSLIIDAVAGTDPVLALRVLLANSGAHDLELRAGALYEKLAEPCTEPALINSSLAIGSESVVLFFGGGVGIGAEVGIDLAARYGCTIVALGRTGWDGVDSYPNASSDAALAEAVFEDMKKQAGSQKISMPALQNAMQQARRQRALTLTASRVKEAGGRFIYLCADVTNEHDVERAIAYVRENVGKIEAVVHAAGVVEDRLVVSKSVESFRRVLHTKARSAFHLQRALQGVDLKFVVFFSSLVAHTGNAGQTDYCAANEVFNSIAQTWSAQANGARVVSILWSAWIETGLAARGVQGILERHALAGVTSADGVRYCHDELAVASGPAWVLITSPHTLEVIRRGPLA